MAKYNLTNSLETSFTFSIDGKEFSFRKPTVREMREISKKFSSVGGEDDAEKQSEMNDAAMRELYSLISPIGHGENIADLIENQTIGVQIAFNDMMKKELGA